MNISVGQATKGRDKLEDEDGTQTSSDMAISLLNIMHKNREAENRQKGLPREDTRGNKQRRGISYIEK
jgi:hypothetical protein